MKGFPEGMAVIYKDESYQNTCQKMIAAGVKFLSENEYNEKNLSDAIFFGGDCIAGGVMLETCISHVEWIRKQGFRAYILQMKDGGINYWKIFPIFVKPKNNITSWVITTFTKS